MDETQGPSKSALKKAEKQAKMLAAKAEKAAARATTVPIVGGAGGAKKTDDSKEIIGITASKDTNFSAWYQDLVIKAELVEYYSEVRRRKTLCLCCSQVFFSPFFCGS